MWKKEFQKSFGLASSLHIMLLIYELYASLHFFWASFFIALYEFQSLVLWVRFARLYSFCFRLEYAGLCISDHEIVFVDSNIAISRQKPVKRKIYMWKKADTQKLKSKIEEMSNNILEKFKINTNISNSLCGHHKANSSHCLDITFIQDINFQYLAGPLYCIHCSS
jgi:hypothetical protein